MSKPTKKPVKRAAAKNPIQTSRSEPMADPDDIEDEMEQEHEEDEALGHIANRDKDPNHPANTTLSPEREPVQRSHAEGFGLSGDDLKTEQEKGGKDPIGKAVHSPGPVETMEDLEIGPRDPYPEGDPPVEGNVKGVTDKPKDEVPGGKRLP